MTRRSILSTLLLAPFTKKLIAAVGPVPKAGFNLDLVNAYIKEHIVPASTIAQSRMDEAVARLRLSLRDAMNPYTTTSTCHSLTRRGSPVLRPLRNVYGTG